jgi:hypothetical protein
MENNEIQSTNPSQTSAAAEVANARRTRMRLTKRTRAEGSTYYGLAKVTTEGNLTIVENEQVRVETYNFPPTTPGRAS